MQPKQLGYIILRTILFILSYVKFIFLKKYLLILLILIAFISEAQTVRKPVAAIYTGLGAYSINHVDVFSFISNQGSLARMKSAGAAVFAEKRFLLDELSLYQAVFAIPTSSGNFGFNAGYYGFSDYNESQFGLAYARKLGEKVDLGVQFNYNGTQISGYGNASAINFEIGTVLHLTEKLHAGVHAYNPVGGKFGKDSEEKIASVYTIGFGYDASAKFFVSTEIEKEEAQPVNINVGMQYKILPQLMARAGITTATSNAYFGAGLFLNSFRLDVTANYHQQLGLTPGILFLYNFNQKQN